MDNIKELGFELIKEIEEFRQSKVITYFTGDRRPYFMSQIGEDAVRPLYDHLLNLEFEPEKQKKLDLFLYSLGGDVSVPWRIVSMIREFCDEFSVLIPYRALSGATLISIGADNIIMGKKAELGPIDPTLERKQGPNKPPDIISVEDINSFLIFVKERAGIKEQNALSQILKCLVDDIGPRVIGSVDRMHRHIRLVAEKLLTTRKQKIIKEETKTIIEMLIEKMFFHGHAIGRKEAKEIGLPIISPDADLEDKMWELFLVYEKFLKLKEPVFPELLLKDKDKEVLSDVPIAIIESLNKYHLFNLTLEIQKKRKIPPNYNMNFNLQLQLPPQISPQQIPQMSQQVLNQLLNQIKQQIPEIVQQEINKQSPVVGFEWKKYNNKWNEIK